MNCKEDKNVNKFTVYLCRMELTGATGGQGAPDKDQRLEIKGPADSWLLPDLKEQRDALILPKKAILHSLFPF